jgi:hypothetical protein
VKFLLLTILFSEKFFTDAMQQLGIKTAMQKVVDVVVFKSGVSSNTHYLVDGISTKADIRALQL